MIPTSFSSLPSPFHTIFLLSSLDPSLCLSRALVGSMPSKYSNNSSLQFGTPRPRNLNPTPEAADQSPSISPYLHDHSSRSTSPLQGEFMTHGHAKRRRRELVLGGVGGTRRKLQFWESPPPPNQSQSIPPPASYRFDLSNINIPTSPFPVPSASGVKRRCCSTDHSHDQFRGMPQMLLHDTSSANKPFPLGYRFLDWIRKVDKLIMEELQRAKHKPPRANKRDRRIGILMSMR